MPYINRKLSEEFTQRGEILLIIHCLALCGIGMLDIRCEVLLDLVTQ